MMKKYRIKKQKVIIIVLILIVVAIFINLYISNNVLLVSNYIVENEKIKNEVKIVLVSDIHNRQFGNNNIYLTEKIKEQKPDIIAIVGDMVNSNTSDFSSIISLLNNLCEIAPVYCSLGNHELSNINKNELIDMIKQTSVILLDDEIAQISVNNNNIAVLGLTWFVYGGGYEEKAGKYISLIESFCKDDDYKLVLCHYPEYTEWFFGNKDYILDYKINGIKTNYKFDFNFDLMLSGHTHGGIIRVPFLGGLIAPNQKNPFPKYDKGQFEITSGKYPYKMIITGGLAGYEHVPRFNNSADISVVCLSSNE